MPMDPEAERFLAGPPMPSRATDHDIQALLTGPALDHLVPVPGGRWVMVSRAEDTILIVYVLGDGTEVMSTTVHMATNPDVAADLCWQHVYGYPAAPLPEAPHAQSSVALNADGQMNSFSQTYLEAPSTNNTWGTGAIVHHSGGAPDSVSAELPVHDQFLRPVHDQDQSQVSLQAYDAPLAAQPESLQTVQGANMTENDSGDPPEFQNEDGLTFSTSPEVLQNGNLGGSDTDPHWNSFASSS
ncbi:hypothetical protein NW762_007568 [Fusarium torreyae]|uniref:Mating type protein 1-2-9 n=1 Tax=Fusarium torreyae TaxID=1237075 RepID=A0A9W8VGD5_9HYPO|nr:hypothetical protein NW762_007568 [Fusarium torreyae]